MEAPALDTGVDKKRPTVAELVELVNSLTPPGAKLRLAAKSCDLYSRQFGENGEENDFLPPRELLQYLVRMGSFTSTPKILNNDDQDNDLHIPKDISRKELLQYCRTQPLLQSLLKRSFRKKFCLKSPPQINIIPPGQNGINKVSVQWSQYVSSPNVIRIFQWNVLSQALGVMNDNFVMCPEDALEWNSRKFHIVEEILQYCPDVICLQEVDHFNFLKRILDTQGFSGMFFPKPDSPCFYIDGNNGPDGCAVFYRRSKFELQEARNKILDIWKVQSNQVAILVTLKIKETGQEICVGTTHLKARNGTILSMLRNEQGKDLLNFVADTVQDRPVVLCGDFNAEPIEPVYNTILNNDLLKLSSAYAKSGIYSQDGPYSEPPYTTWKVREEGEVCHTIDYVFYSSDKMDVEQVLDFPTEKEIGDGRVPSYAYPSDHFSLVCDLKLLDSQSAS